ncbi:MAG: DUF721 domain-containing protein [Spirochaetales bacterium]|nr:DUF721 domain-containing protein [Spirochaetales bacterium]
MEKAEEIISLLFDKNIQKESRSFVNINNKWAEILQDSRLADHCRLEDIENGAIKVSFDHPGWIQVFKMNQSRILRRLNQKYANLNIHSVSMFLKDQKIPERKESAPESPVPKSEKKDYKANMESIKDDELKLRLENLKKKLQGDN